MSQPPQRGDPHKSDDVATNQLVAKVSRLYAQAAPEDQFALRVWMRDIILGRKEGSVNMRQARRNENRMVEACERRILEFPLDMDAREVAKELKREGWYAWASNHDGIVSRIKHVRAKAETEERVWLIPIALSGRRRSYHQKTRVVHSPFASARY